MSDCDKSCKYEAPIAKTSREKKKVVVESRDTNLTRKAVYRCQKIRPTTLGTVFRYILCAFLKVNHQEMHNLGKEKNYMPMTSNVPAIVATMSLRTTRK